jgi:hypothetical protein
VLIIKIKNNNNYLFVSGETSELALVLLNERSSIFASDIFQYEG